MGTLHTNRETDSQSVHQPKILGAAPEARNGRHTAFFPVRVSCPITPSSLAWPASSSPLHRSTACVAAPSRLCAPITFFRARRLLTWARVSGPRLCSRPPMSPPKAAVCSPLALAAHAPPEAELASRFATLLPTRVTRWKSARSMQQLRRLQRLDGGSAHAERVEQRQLPEVIPLLTRGVREEPNQGLSSRARCT
jgi:hypothetical protein